MTIAHPRPTEPRLSVHREDVDGTCAACGAARLQAYPVLSEAGWFDVVKCQECLTDVTRTPGPKLGPIELLSDRI
jgi:vanillate/4-hydroxybenzoate decarboxylase subunit D